MSEMVERVAQALCGDDNPANILTIHRIRARAAVTAMRDPTEAMIGAMGFSREEVISGWQVMIDEALK